jgi:GDP-4-dehydro-6-deoxy-D-mannose reductase
MPPGPTLVTGAAGFAGGHLIDRLAPQGNIVAVYHSQSGQPDRHIDGCVWQPMDVQDRGSVEVAITAVRPDRIYHLAGAPHPGESWLQSVHHLRLHVLGTHYLLDAVRRFVPRCRVLVVTSAQIYRTSPEALDEEAPLQPANPYGLSKLAEDQLALDAARQDDLDVVIARPFNHAGPRQAATFSLPSFARQIARIELGTAPPELQVGNLDARRDVSDVRDVVAAYERIMEAAPTARPFNVCRGEAYVMGDLLTRLAEMASVRVRTVTDPDRLRPNDQPVVLGNPARLRTELGWSPVISIDTTLQDTLDWWRGEVRRTG